MMQNAKTLLLDLDGTLIDPKDGITKSIQYALEQLGRPPVATEDLFWCIGPSIFKSFQILFKDEPEIAARGVALYRERYGQTGKFENVVYDGIREMLERLRASFCLVVATAKPTVFAKEILEHYALAGYFHGVYGSELNGTRADKAELIAYILEQEKKQAADCTMIGDREYDVRGAKMNSIPGYGVAWGYGSREELTQAGALGIFSQPSELIAHFLGG